MSENMMCPSHKDNKKYRDKYDDIFLKKEICKNCGKIKKITNGKWCCENRK